MPNEYDAIVGEDISEAKGSEFDAIVEETDEERRIRLEQSLRVGAQKNPDNQAKVIDLSERTGLTPDVVELKQAEVESRIQQRNNDYDFLFEEAPSTAQLLSDPNMAGVAHDDVDNLANTERAVRSPLSFRDRLGAAGKKGLAVVESSEIGLARMLSVLNLGPEVDQKRIARLSEIEHFMEFEDESGFFGGIPTAVFEQLPILGAILAEAGKVGVATGGVAALATGIVTKNPALTGKAFAFGFGVGAKVGTFGGAFELEAGLAFNEFTAADEHGRQLDEESAAAGAVMVGFVNAALESFSLRLLGKTFKGAKPLIRKQVRQALTTKTGRDIAKKVLSAYMASVAGEGITEAMQELSNIIGDNLLKALDGDDFDEFKFKNAVDGIFSQETLERAGGAGRVGLQAATGLGIPGSVVSASVQGARTQSASESEQETLDTVIENAQESKVRERAPTIYAQLIKDAVEDAGTVSDVYLTATEVQAFLESEGVDLSAETQDNPAIEAMVKQLPEALAGETDVVIPLEDFATYVTPSESFESIRPHIKLSAETLTQDQLSNSDKNLQDRVKELMEEAQNNLEVLRQAEVVFEDVKDQLLDTATMTPEAAATAAEIIPAYVTTKAVRTGLSVEEVYQRIGLKIVGPESATLEGGQEQLIGPEALQAKRLEKLNQERELLLETSTQAVFEGGETKRFLRTLSQKRGDLAEIDIDDDAALTERLSELLRDIGGALPRNAEFRFDELTGNIVQRGEDKATPEGLLEQVRALQARLPELDKTTSEFAEKNQDIDRRIDASFSGPTVFKQEIEGDLLDQIEKELDIEFAEGDEVVERFESAQINTDQGRILRLLGPVLYGDMNKVAEVTVKELFQNAFDATRTAILKGQIEDGEITVTADEDSRTITVTDNGVGMTPEMIRTGLLTIGGTEKEGEINSGGFGIAKMLFLAGAASTVIETVRDGVKSTLSTTGAAVTLNADDPANPLDPDRPADEAIRIQDTTEPNGTKMTVVIPEKFTDARDGVEKEIKFVASYKVSDNTKEQILHPNITVKRDTGFGPITEKSGKEFENELFTKIGVIEFEWGTADLLVSREKTAGYHSNAQISVNGLKQFAKTFTRNPFELLAAPIKRTFVVDIHPNGDPDDPSYPFTLDRQDLKPHANADMLEIQKFLAIRLAADITQETAKGFGNIQQLNEDGTIGKIIELKPKIKEGRGLLAGVDLDAKLSIIDGRLSLDGKEQKFKRKDLGKVLFEIDDFKVDQKTLPQDRPILHNYMDFDGPDGKGDLISVLYEQFGEEKVNGYFKEVGDVFLILRNAIASFGDKARFEDIDNIGVGVSVLGNRYYGVHTHVPANFMLINPGSDPMGESDSFEDLAPIERHRLIASSMLTTMEHEAAHFSEFRHDVPFLFAMQGITAVISARIGLRDNLIFKLEKAVGENIDIYDFINEQLAEGNITNRSLSLKDVGVESARSGGDITDDAGEREADTESRDTGERDDGVVGEATAEPGPDELFAGVRANGTNVPSGSVSPKAGDGSQLNKVFQQDRRGEIAFDEDGNGAVIRLTEAANLSTFLHESGHLFLEMEKRFFLDPSIPDSAKADGQAILDWLEVDTFDDIESEHHEKWAVGFEAYLFEGNAPSLELKGVFRRFAAWLAKVYQGLRTLQVPLTPEIRGVMDRMLATDEQIAEVKGKLKFEPLFKTAEEAGMTPEKFAEYQNQTQGTAEERLRKKVLAQLRRTAQKWWQEELEAVREGAREELAAEPLYRAIDFMRQKLPPEGFIENKMDRRTVYELLGLAVPKELKKDRNAVDPSVDTLSEAIAKLGGLDRTEAEAQGVDPAQWRNIKVTKIKEGRTVRVSVPNPDNLPLGVGKPLFRATGGRSFDGMRELLSELGYMGQDDTESALLDRLLADLSGDTQYSNLVDFDKLFEDPAEATVEKRKAPGQLRGLTKFDGASPDTIATIFGFRSGAELVRQIVETPTLNEAADRRAQATMIERHGDILNDGTLEREALEAAHNTEQGNQILTELRALAGQTDTEVISDRKAIKLAAEKIIGGIRISALRPAIYRNAEVKAAQDAREAQKAGDLAGAQAAKEKQYLNFHLYRAAIRARDKAQTLKRRGRQMQTKKYSDKEARPEYITRLKQLLAVYDFKQANKEARENAALILEGIKSWLRVQQTDPESPANIVEVDTLDRIVHYREMTIDQLEAVMDVAKSLLHAARKNSQAEREAFKENMKAIAANIAEKSTTTESLPEGDSPMKSVRAWGRAATATHRKIESLVRQADGFVDLGPLWRRVIKPLLEANNKRLTMQLKAHDDLNAIFLGNEGIFNARHRHLSFTFSDGRSVSYSLNTRIAIALNWGNLGNREAMLNQEHVAFTEEDIQQVLDSLTDTDWDLVESVWDYVDSFWPQIAELEKSFTGVVPRKVDAEPFQTKDGRTIKGGYYPLVTDARLSFRGRQEEIEKRAERLRAGGVTRATTAQGHTIERVGFNGRDVDLSINVLFNHVDNVIHDISHRRAVSDSDGVLRNKDIRKALIASIGQSNYSTMLARVTEVAAGFIHPNELGAIERGLRWARLALTYSALGFSMKSGFSQMLGTATASAEFGAANVARGFMDFYSDPVKHAEFINEKSVFMRDRLHTQNRDTGTILRNLKGKTAWNGLRERAFFFLLQGDLVVSRAVWWMAYNDGMERAADPNNTEFDTENDAINFADRSVSRTQQSGLLMDLTAVESKNEFVKLWTVMYSAFSAIYQIAVEQTKKYQLGRINAVELTYNIVWLLVIPALFEELLTGRDEDDDEDELLDLVNNRWTRSVAAFSLGTMAFIREIGWAMRTGQTSELPLQRVLSTPIDLATQIEQGELDAAAIRSATAVLGALHIPGGSQLNRSLNYWLAYEEGDEEYFDIWEFLITGPREDE